MREYGDDAFAFEVIASAIKKGDLAALERDLIEQYDAENEFNSDGPKRWAKASGDLAASYSLLFKAINKVGADRVSQALLALLD